MPEATRRSFGRIVIRGGRADTIDASARVTFAFTFRAVPSSPLGIQLAASGALVQRCREPRNANDRIRRERPHRRRRDDDLIADCPRGPRYLSHVDAR